MGFVSILSLLFGQVPLLIVWIAGIVFAVSRWQQHPRTSRLITIALSGMIVLALMNAIVNVVLPRIAIDGGVTQIGLYFGVWGTLSGLVHAVLWVVLLWAIFDRHEQPPRFQ